MLPARRAEPDAAEHAAAPATAAARAAVADRHGVVEGENAAAEGRATQSVVEGEIAAHAKRVRHAAAAAAWANPPRRRRRQQRPGAQRVAAVGPRAARSADLDAPCRRACVRVLVPAAPSRSSRRLLPCCRVARRHAEQLQQPLARRGRGVARALVVRRAQCDALRLRRQQPQDVIEQLPDPRRTERRIQEGEERQRRALRLQHGDGAVARQLLLEGGGGAWRAASLRRRQHVAELGGVRMQLPQPPPLRHVGHLARHSRQVRLHPGRSERGVEAGQQARGVGGPIARRGAERRNRGAELGGAARPRPLDGRQQAGVPVARVPRPPRRRQREDQQQQEQQQSPHGRTSARAPRPFIPKDGQIRLYYVAVATQRSKLFNGGAALATALEQIRPLQLRAPRVPGGQGSSILLNFPTHTAVQAYRLVLPRRLRRPRCDELKQPSESFYT